MLDDPGVAAVDLEQRGGAVLEQLQRVPLAVGERRLPDGPLHLPQHARIGDVVDVAVPQLRGGGKKDVRDMKTLLKCHSESKADVRQDCASLSYGRIISHDPSVAQQRLLTPKQAKRRPCWCYTEPSVLTKEEQISADEDGG